MKFIDRRGETLEIPDAPPVIYPHNGLADLRLSSAIHRHVLAVIEYTEGNMSWAADELAIDSVTLWRFVNEFRGVTTSRGPRKKYGMHQVAP